MTSSPGSRASLPRTSSAMPAAKYCRRCRPGSRTAAPRDEGARHRRRIAAAAGRAPGDVREARTRTRRASAMLTPIQASRGTRRRRGNGIGTGAVSASANSVIEANRSFGLERQRPTQGLLGGDRRLLAKAPHSGRRLGEPPGDDGVEGGRRVRRRAGEHLVAGGGQGILIGPRIRRLAITCSGAMYAGVPIPWPASVRCSVGWRTRLRAMPKSASKVTPSSVSRMLPGFTSRWTTPSRWA